MSFGISALENNIHFDDTLRYFFTKDQSESKDDLITASLKKEPTEEIVESYGKPVSIKIDSVGIDLRVKEGVYNEKDQTWTLTNGYAYWANLSGSIFAKGSSTVIYAHNQWNEFYKTKDLKIGDKITIVTDSGKNIVFEYRSDKIVNPNDGSVIFEKSTESQIILITCNGWISENRRIMYATLTDVN